MKLRVSIVQESRARRRCTPSKDVHTMTECVVGSTSHPGLHSSKINASPFVRMYRTTTEKSSLEKHATSTSTRVEKENGERWLKDSVEATFQSPKEGNRKGIDGRSEGDNGIWLSTDTE